jgi:AmpD protein
MERHLIVDHRLVDVRQVDSPNRGERPVQAEIDLLVLHNISLPPGQYGTGCVEAFFCNALDADAHEYFATIAHIQVSAHLFIERTGDMIQFVPFDKTAWHAGKSEFMGREACNDFSIGIELEGCDDEPFTDEQYLALGQAVALIQNRYPNITLDRIVGHSDIAPGRKTDPGPCFDWERFRSMCVKQVPVNDYEDRS